MAPITSAVAALQRHAARRAVLMLKRERGPPASGAAAAATASTFATTDQPVKDVLVVGAGVAGLATAACLGRLGVRVTVVEGRQKVGTGGPAGGRAGAGREGARHKRKHEGGSSTHERDGAAVRGLGVGGGVVDPGVGIWTHGLACLNDLGILRRLEAEGRYMGEAGYRDAAGNWLATPCEPLQDFNASRETSKPPAGGSGGRAVGSGASVLFVRESKLIEALRSVVPEDTTFVGGDAEYISWGGGGCDVGAGGTHGGKKGEGVGGGGMDRGTASGRFCGGTTSSVGDGDGDGNGNGGDSAAAASRWTVEFDLLVGADGPESFVRSKATPESLGLEAAAPQRRGYVVYRGVCSSGSAAASAAAAAAAAASVGGEEGGREGWGLESFQTWGPGLRFASVPLAGDERMWFATVADGVNDGSGSAGASAGSPQQASPLPGEVKEFLLRRFGGWHAPIASLIRATEETDIAREDAKAMSRTGLRAAAAAGASARQARRGVVLVGDAAHTLDPVLAQGAGVALEDAFFLAHRVKDLNASAAAAAGGPKAGAAGDGRAAREGLEQTLAGYDADRLERALLLSYLSDVSQTLGQLQRPAWLLRARDSSLARYIPSNLRSRVFDALMSASLSGGLAGAAAAAAGAAAGTGGVRRDGRGRFGGYRVPRL